MNPEYEKRLEMELDRELKGLPDVTAPEDLSRRVMAAIEATTAPRWYRQSWQFWPTPVQVLSLGIMLLLFGALCFEVWKLKQYAAVSPMGQEVGVWFAWGSTWWNAVNTVFAALVLTVKQFGTWILLACFGALALAWALCLGLGTVYLRIAFARR
jgi:hypothetical protein